MPNQKSSLNPFFRLVGYTKSFKYWLIFTIILTIISVALSVQLPIVFGNATTLIVNSFIASNQTQLDWSGLLIIIQQIVVLVVLSGVINFLSKAILSKIAAITTYRLQNELKRKLTHVPIRYYDENANGELISRATTDMETIDNSFAQVMVQFLTALVTFIGIIIMMFLVNPILALIGLLGIPLSGMLIAMMSKRTGKLFGKQQMQLGQLNAFIEEQFTGHEIVKSFVQEDNALHHFTQLNNAIYDTSWKAQFLAGLMFPISRLVNNIVYVVIAIVGGLFASNGTMTIGNVQAIMQFTQQLSQPMGDVANMFGLIQSMNAACARVFELLDSTEMPDDSLAPDLPSVNGTVDFEHVAFGYSDDNLLITNLNIHVNAGETVAIVGPTGAGKTTVINLLMRFYDIKNGAIKIDGHDISNYSKQSLRNHVGMVLQDTWLFNGTIRENIRYGKQDATDEEVYAAAKQAFADDFIRKLPHGYDTIIKESSDNISQGQKQLLTIARAILATPSIFILDEATSNIDTRTEVQIQRAMDHIMENKTSFVIAHRLSTIRNADKILVMKHGNVIEQGTHDTLLAQNGFYASLYQAQFEQ